jgi:hypothetical protein
MGEVRRRVLLAIACATIAGCSATAPAALTVAPAPAPGHLLIGAAASSYSSFAASTGVAPTIVEHYASTGASFDPSFAGPAEPMVQLEPRGVTMPSVAAGSLDRWLSAYAKAVAAYGRPVILGWAPEMNGAWYTWGYRHTTPAEYISAWRHVVGLFRADGARNVTWIWTVNVDVGGTGSAAVENPAAWWPGSAWVGMTGIDGYYYGPGQTFASLFDPMVDAVRKLGHDPVLLSETGVAPAAGQPAKIRDLFAGARADSLLGVVYFDLPGNRDWRLASAAALTAYKTAVRGAIGS